MPVGVAAPPDIVNGTALATPAVPARAAPAIKAKRLRRSIFFYFRGTRLSLAGFVPSKKTILDQKVTEVLPESGVPSCKEGRQGEEITTKARCCRRQQPATAPRDRLLRPGCRISP